jgi:RNA-binding protein NOB1
LEESLNEGNEEEEENNDEENDDGWIKPSNLEEKKKLDLINSDEKELGKQKLKVGCMTSDFSMQV